MYMYVFVYTYVTLTAIVGASENFAENSGADGDV